MTPDGRVSVVTGGGAGIGRGVALALAEAGSDIALLEIDGERAERTASDVEALGREALAVSTDVMDADRVRSAIDAVVDRFGRIDVLVNNAGGVRASPFLEQSERSWRRHIDINLLSMLAATASAAPVMIEGGRGGSILNVSSIEAFRAAPLYAVYAACKAAMVNFTRTMALELADHRIRVNGIAPDKTVTPGLLGMAGGAVTDADLAPGADDAIPLGREGAIEECGALAAFLCSEAAAYITGETVHIDGGTFASSGWIRSADGSWTLRQDR